jgi:MFS family permease
MSIAVILLIGDKTDKWGSHKPLVVLTLIVGASMSLWFFSAWGGLACVIAYQVINGASGNTLAMVGGNFGLEITPAKGRAAYTGFYTLVGLPFALGTTFFSGYLVHHLKDVHYSFHGAVLSRYHIVFFCTTVLALVSAIPLMLVRTKRLEAGDE